MTASLCACVIARDEEAHIRRCLESLDWVDECVVVVDERSRDATERIAREMGARVERRPYEGNIEQKNGALALAKGAWILALDADEAVSPQLARRIRAALETDGDGCAGFELNRVTWHLGRWIRHGDFHPDWQLRLFRSGRGRWAGANPHGRVQVDGEVGRLAGDLEHRSYADLADQVTRIREFSRIEAEAMHAAGRSPRLRDLVLRPPARFLRAYLLKSGYRDGVPGFVIAAASAFHVFLKYAMLWERARAGQAAGR